MLPQYLSRRNTMSTSIGSIAGQVWQYLNKNGAHSVTKIAKETDIETKQLQRAIGWLAKEDKIIITLKGRTEVIGLK
jgi:hypothetical protein